MIPAQNIVASGVGRRASGVGRRASGVEDGSGVPIGPRVSGHTHPRPAGAVTPPRRANVK